MGRQGSLAQTTKSAAGPEGVKFCGWESSYKNNLFSWNNFVVLNEEWGHYRTSCCRESWERPIYYHFEYQEDIA